MASTLQNACTQKSDLLMNQYNWHHGPQQQIRESSSDPYLIYYWSHFSSCHCVSWLFISSEQEWHSVGLYLTVYLMPYLLLSFLGGSLAERQIRILYVGSLSFCIWAEVYNKNTVWTVRTRLTPSEYMFVVNAFEMILARIINSHSSLKDKSNKSVCARVCVLTKYLISERKFYSTLHHC